MNARATPAAGATDEPTQLDRAIAFLEPLTKAAAVLGGIAYVLGLFVWQTHLQQFGSGTLDFFAPQYITAGVLTLAFLGIFGLSGCLIGVLTQRGVETLAGESQGSWVKHFSLGFRVLVLTLVLAFVLLKVLRLEEATPDFKTTDWVMMLVLQLGSGFYAAGGIKIPERYRDNPFFQVASYLFPFIHPTSINRVVVATFGVLFALGIFASKVYPAIPARWGGGACVRAQLVISQEQAQRFYKATITTAEDQAALFGQLILLTDKEVLVLPDNHQTPILLPRSELRALVFGPIDSVAAKGQNCHS